MTGPFTLPEAEHFLSLLHSRFPAAVRSRTPKLKLLSSLDSVVIAPGPFLGDKAFEGRAMHEALERASDLLRNPLAVRVVPGILDRSWCGFLLDWCPPAPANLHQVAAVDPVGRLYLVEERIGWQSRPKIVLGGASDVRPNWLHTDLKNLAAAARSLRGWMNLN